MKINTTSPVLALVVVGAMSLAACGGSDSGASDSDPCDAGRAIADAIERITTAEDAEIGLAAAADFADALDDIEEVVPDEFKDDVELLADGSRQLADSDLETGPTAEVLELLAGDEYDVASERLEEYIQANCDIDF